MNSRFSVYEIGKELRKILHEYRSGAREPTVVSQAIFSNTQVEAEAMKAELTQQIHADLEDKDIHPNSIRFNDSFIQQWLDKTMADGGLQESVETAEDTNQSKMKRESTKMHSIDPSTAPQASITLDATSDDRSASHDNEGDEKHHTPPDDLYIPEILEFNNDLPRPPSRAETFSSHKSKPEDWQPYDTPNPEWVRGMLLPLFNQDPFMEMAETEPDLRIKRAFYQQDYDCKGAIADHKVLQLCIEVLESTGLSEKLNELSTIVYALDIDGNGQFDEDEYMKLMKMLIKKAMEWKKDNLLRILKQYGVKADQAIRTDKKFVKKHPEFLCWGWDPPRRPRNFYHHTITDAVSDPPPLLPASSFTIMAHNARIAIKTIDEFEERWLKMVPKEPELLQDFKAPLEVARRLSYRFIPFENQRDRFAKSDLDMMVCFGKIHLSSGGSKDEIPFSIPDLQEAQQHAYPIIQLIQGLVFILTKISQELGNINEAHNYTRLNEKLRSHQITLLAKALKTDAPALDWDKHVTRKIVSYHRADNESFLMDLESKCKLRLSRYNNRLCAAQVEAEIQMTKWTVYIERLEVTGWKISRSRKLLGTK